MPVNRYVQHQTNSAHSNLNNYILAEKYFVKLYIKEFICPLSINSYERKQPFTGTMKYKLSSLIEIE
jgi:hypothetical protein